MCGKTAICHPLTLFETIIQSLWQEEAPTQALIPMSTPPVGLKGFLLSFLSLGLTSGPRAGMQHQEGWVGSASAPPLGAAGPGQQGPMQGRMGPSGAPMRPNSQPGPRQMLQPSMMTNGEKQV